MRAWLPVARVESCVCLPPAGGAACPLRYLCPVRCPRTLAVGCLRVGSVGVESWFSLLFQWKKHWFVLADQSLRFYRDSVAEEVSVSAPFLCRDRGGPGGTAVPGPKSPPGGRVAQSRSAEESDVPGAGSCWKVGSLGPAFGTQVRGFQWLFLSVFFEEH